MSSRPLRPRRGGAPQPPDSGTAAASPPSNGRVSGTAGSKSRAAGSLAGTRSGLARQRALAENNADALVNLRLRMAAAYSWRILIVGAAVYVAYLLLLRFELVGIALFLALVFTALLRPPVNVLSRRMPRPLAVLVSMLGSIAVIGGVFTLVGTTVANESGELGKEFSGGLGRIEQWLEGSPFHVSPSTLSGLQGKVSSFVASHRSTLISQALSGASRAVEVLTVVALAVFCSIFFTKSGDQMWRWFTTQLPGDSGSTWDRAGRAAWSTFSGYTRGVIIVAGTNAVMVGISLYLLKVPLALPLTILEFIASFVPLVGSPVAMAVATVVALAGRGVVTALIVLVLIVVFGQIEGHVLQPLVMGWAVRLHPVMVAVSVIAGSIVAGVVGAVVAVPMVSIAWSVVRELRSEPAGDDADVEVEAPDPS
ncbi:AI-2E family transporter [Actinocrinis puniceicyclus]|uniref:AI-2E family transporter n=1 Tax=Actinocrinis puniceicyclus TaxID=977794 RepID=A0A8J7WQH6_9ACTN|nr:AI-2E family transporter [Actinocrinis puniceicyclus]MBS2964199.1 AI-2E family transporter [Actinocrinis puniceicyclus]